MVSKISRVLYNSIMDNPDKKKAVAFAIYVKYLHPASVIPMYNAHKLAKEVGMHHQTVKKYVNILISMGLAEYTAKGNTHLSFKRLGAEYNNIRIDLFSNKSFKDILSGLDAMFIVEKQSQKEYVQQQEFKATNPSPNDSIKAIKRAKAFCNKRGLAMIDENGNYEQKFRDYGMSYNYLCKNLRRGRALINRAIKKGEEFGLFNVERGYRRVERCKDMGFDILPFVDGGKYAYKDCVVIVMPNKFQIGISMEQYYKHLFKTNRGIVISNNDSLFNNSSISLELSLSTPLELY